MSSIRRARWQRGRANSGAEGRWRPRFTGGEACWPGSAGWRKVESRAEECSHAPRQTCGRSERVAKRWRPRNARGTSEGVGGGGGRDHRPSGPPAGASGGEHRAGNAEQAKELPASRPAAPDATLSSAEPHPGPPALPGHPGVGGVGGFSRPSWVQPARDCPVDLPSEVPEGV